MSRQYFSEVVIDPPTANLAAITTTALTSMWSVPQFTPIHAFDAYRGVGKIYRLTAGGIWSTSASASTATISPFFGPTTAGVALGASGAQTLTASLPSTPWTLQFWLVVRAIGAPGANSTVVGTGVFNGAGLVATAASNNTILFGGAPATVDLSIETGICIGWTFGTNAGSITPQYAFIQSLN
jgi:hypothetical protein